MRKILFFIAIMLALTACGGGGGGGTPTTLNPNPAIITQLVPLNVSLEDELGNPITVIDVSKVGSHMQYKLTFTNPNSVTVTAPFNLGSDTNWVGYQMSIIHQESSPQQYFDEHNPGIGATISYFYSTTNTDDCFNVSYGIPPGGSCSYYMLAIFPGSNFTNQTTFSYPLSYSIHQPEDFTTNLDVEQCTYTEVFGPPEYNCSNAAKPGYANQFISYKVNPTNGLAPSAILSGFNGLSQDGTSLYMCDASTKGVQYAGINCGVYSLIYEGATNELSYLATPLSTFTLNSSANSSRYGVIGDSVFVTPDGSMAWYVLNDYNQNYSLINSNDPDSVWEGCFGGPLCVPNMTASSGYGNGAVMGLDGTFWWSILNPSSDAGADIYVAESNIFVETNIGAVGGVTPDGTVIGWNIGTGLSCWRKNPTDSYTSYVATPVANYVWPTIGTKYASQGSNVYVAMEIPNLVNNYGQYLQPVYGGYKVHTENGKCELQLDDYTTYLNVQVTGGYAYGYDYSGGGDPDAMVVPLSDIYFGK